MKERLALLFVAVLIASFTAGYRRAGKKTEMEEAQKSHKVEIVENSALPKFSDFLTLKLEREISDSGIDGKWAFIKPIQILVDEQKKIYVLDIKDRNIKKFDSNGRYIETIGRPGIGPTELDGLSRMIISNNELGVWCPGKAEFVYFDLNGKYKRTAKLFLRISQIAADSHGNIFGTVSSPSGGRELIRLDHKLQVVNVIDRRPWEPMGLFGATLTFAIIKSEVIIVGNPTNHSVYELKAYNYEGKLVRLIRKNHKPIHIPRKEAEIARKKNVLNLNIPEYYMPYIGLYSSEKGLIIVYLRDRLEGGREKYFDIFSSEGEYLGRTVLRNFIECLWDNERLYTIEENEEGFPTVRIYKAFWNEGR